MRRRSQPRWRHEPLFSSLMNVSSLEQTKECLTFTRIVKETSSAENETHPMCSQALLPKKPKPTPLFLFRCAVHPTHLKTFTISITLANSSLTSPYIITTTLPPTTSDGLHTTTTAAALPWRRLSLHSLHHSHHHSTPVHSVSKPQYFTDAGIYCWELRSGTKNRRYNSDLSSVGTPLSVSRNQVFRSEPRLLESVQQRVCQMGHYPTKVLLGPTRQVIFGKLEQIRC